MAVKTRFSRGANATQPRKPSRTRKTQAVPPLQAHLMHYLPVWLLVGGVILMLLPGILSGILDLAGRLLHLLPWLILAAIALTRLPRILAFARFTARRTLRAAPRLASSGLRYGRALVLRRLPLWMVFGAALLLVVPGTRSAILDGAGRVLTLVPGIFRSGTPTEIAPLFTAEVDYWSDDIRRWADEYDLDPNLLATVMQIESCGHPTVSSYAGAQGLFQVMPFHFASGENQLDPDTNARRGAQVLNDCLGWADGDPGLAMACYNAGPRVLTVPYDSWDSQPQRYFTWGTGIYADATHNHASSAMLDLWLDAGGQRLCDLAGDALGIE